MTGGAQITETRRGLVLMDGPRVVATARPIRGQGYRVKLYGASFWPRGEPSRVTGGRLDSIRMVRGVGSVRRLLSDLRGVA